MIFVDIWFKQNKYKRMHFAILDSNKVENWKSLRKLNQATCARDCFRVLRDEELFTYENVIFVQYLLKTTHCEELYTQCVEYAKTQKALCFYEAPTGNLYENPVDMTNCKALIRNFSQQSDNVYLLSVFSKFLIIQSKRICFLNTLYLQISSVYLQSIRSSAIYNLVTTNILKYIFFYRKWIQKCQVPCWRQPFRLYHRRYSKN